MSVPVKLFRSSDTGAPTLTGQAGSLIALLDAVLINGYNLKSVSSITRTGQTATVTFATAHGFAIDGKCCVLIAGAGQAEYNGEFMISNVTANSFDITVTGSPATPATGTITAIVAPVGTWSKLSGTNLAAYKSTDTGATGRYVRLDDTAGVSGKYATITGYESMSDVNTGVSVGQTRYWMKSTTADTAQRPWCIIADGKMVYLCIAWTTAITNTQPIFEVYWFGDLISYLTGDTYHFSVAGTTASNQTQVGALNGSTISNLDGRDGGASPADVGTWIARDYGQTTAVLGYKFSASGAKNMASTSQFMVISGSAAFSVSTPNPGLVGNDFVDGAIHFCPVYVAEKNASTFGIRGEMPGMLHIIEHSLSIGAVQPKILSGVSGINDSAVLLQIQSYYSAAAMAGTIAFNLGAWR